MSSYHHIINILGCTYFKDVLNKVLFYGIFSSRTARRHGTPWTSPTRTKLAENLWNTFERLRATWISVELRSLLVTRHDPSTFPKIGSKNATNFWNARKSFGVEEK